MADDPKISTASSVKDWVEAYYGDDAFDISKAKKIGHIYHTAQFSACCYVISKASKKAHADLFDSNYAALDTTYARIAEMCIKLLEIKFRENRPLAKADFLKCGWKNIFDEKKLDEYFEDYVGPAGILDRCQSCFPIIKDKVMGDDGKEHEVVNTARTADGFKAVKDDIADVKKDHTYLLTLTGAKDGILSRENVFKLFDSTTDAASKTWKEKKSEKSNGEKELLKLNEEMFHSRYELVKSTTKNAVVAGAAVMSLGAVISGVFWPAILLIPEYSLLKKNMPDMFKSLGKYWGQIEKKFKTKRDIKRAAAAQEYITRYAEFGKDARIPFRIRRYLRASDITILKKQAKVVNAGLSLEWSDEKKHDSELEIAKKALFNSRFYSQSNSDIMKKDELAPIDLQAVLENEIKAINPDKVDFLQMNSVAVDIKEFAQKLPSDAQESVQNKYAETLMASAKRLIFETPLETVNDYQYKTAKFITDNSVLFEPIKDIRPDIVETIKSYSTMAGKEIKGLDGGYLGKSLEDYIMRTPEPNNSRLNISWETSKTKFKNPADGALKKVIDAISDLQISDKDDKMFVGNGYDFKNLNQEIAQIANDEDRDFCDRLLKEQMKRVSYEKTRADSRATFEALTKKNSDLGGKLNFNEAFKKISEVTYDNIGNYVRFYEDTNTMKPPQVGAYLRAKFRSAVHDVMRDHAKDENNIKKFKTDLKELTTFLSKVNACLYLDEKQKSDLSAIVIPYIADTLETKCKAISNDFNSYDYTEFNKYVEENYEGFGFKTLFDKDKSAETTMIKQKLESMKRLKEVKVSLDFGGTYKINQNDLQVISQILIRDEKNNFETTKIRKSNDKLLEFLTLTIRQGKTTDAETKGVSAQEIRTNIRAYSRYNQLESKLQKIADNEYGFENVYDQYAALLALKNKCYVNFMQFLNQVIKNNQGTMNLTTFLETEEGRDYYNAVINGWKPLFGQFDTEKDKIADKLGLKKIDYASSGLSEYLDLHNDRDSETMNQRQL